MTFNNMPPIYEAQAIAEAEKAIRLSENAHQLEAGKFADKAAKILKKCLTANSTNGMRSVVS